MKVIEYNYYHTHQLFVSVLYLFTDKAFFPSVSTISLI